MEKLEEERKYIDDISNNVLIELWESLDERPESKMTKKERWTERRKFLDSYRSFRSEIRQQITKEREEEDIPVFIQRIVHYLSRLERTRR